MQLKQNFSKSYTIETKIIILFLELKISYKLWLKWNIFSVPWRNLLQNMWKWFCVPISENLPGNDQLYSARHVNWCQMKVPVVWFFILFYFFKVTLNCKCLVKVWLKMEHFWEIFINQNLSPLSSAPVCFPAVCLNPFSISQDYIGMFFLEHKLASFCWQQSDIKHANTANFFCCGANASHILLFLDWWQKAVFVCRSRSWWR